MARAPKTVESFGPEIFEALITGSRREIILELPYKKAVAFRQRANSLRAAMRDAKHDKYKIVAQTSLRILWGKEAGFDEVSEKKSSQNVRSPVSGNVPAKLIISPADAEFASALAKAGVTIRPLGTDPAPVIPDTSTEEPSEDILARILKGEDLDATNE